VALNTLFSSLNECAKDVFSTMGAADLDAVGVSITNMGSMETVFDVVGEGSTAMVMNLFIGDNDFSAINPPIRWTGIAVRDRAFGSFFDTTISNSTNIRHVFSASINSNLDILRAQISDLSGGREVVSVRLAVDSCYRFIFYLLIKSNFTFLQPGYLGCKCDCFWKHRINRHCESDCNR